MSFSHVEIQSSPDPGPEPRPGPGPTPTPSVAAAPTGNPRRSRLELLGAALVYLVFVAVWLVPRGFQPAARILGHGDADGVKHYWNLWWFRQMALEDGRLPFQTDYLNFPQGFPLYPIEPLNGLAGLLLIGPLGLATATNVIAVLNLALAGVGMFCLVRSITGRFWPSLSGGLIYALSSYAIWTVYVGVGELSHLAWMPLALMYLLRAARDGGVRNIAAATGLFFLTAFACWYYALFLFLLAGLWAATDWWRGRQTPRVLGRYIVIFGLSLACLMPIIKTFNSSYPASPRSTEPLGMFIANRINAHPHDGPDTRLDVANLISGGPQVRLAAIKNPYLGGRFIGVSLLVLAGLGILLSPLRSSRWVLMLAVSLCLGMGSRLVLAGQESGGLLPFAWFNLVLDRYSQAMNFPARFIMPVTLTLAVLSGIGLSRVQALTERLLSSTSGRTRAGVAGAVVAVLGLIPLLEGRARGDVPTPLPSHPIAPLAAGPVVAGMTGTAVIEIPQAFHESGRRNRDEILLMQIAHGKKSAAMPLDRISNFVNSGRHELKGQPLIVALKGHGGLPEQDDPPNFMNLPPDDPDVVLQRKWLIDRGFSQVIVTYRGLPPIQVNSLRAFCEHVFGKAEWQDEIQAVYTIREQVRPPDPDHR